MAQPQLYQSYATEKIVSFFGSPDEAQSFCNGQWLIFPKTAICLANVSKWPEKSFFDNGSNFYWVADQPYFAPAHVLGSKAKERAIHLFASPPDSPEFLYVGELEPSNVSVAPGKGNYGMAMFALRPTLPGGAVGRMGCLVGRTLAHQVLRLGFCGRGIRRAWRGKYRPGARTAQCGFGVVRNSLVTALSEASPSRVSHRRRGKTTQLHGPRYPLFSWFPDGSPKG